MIELRDITRWYGPHQALKGVTCELPPGRIGLLGPNGAGKSTLLKILLGLLPPSSGTGRVLGHDLAHAGSELRRAIGYMPEADALLPGLRGADYVAMKIRLLRKDHDDPDLAVCFGVRQAIARLESSAPAKQSP